MKICFTSLGCAKNLVDSEVALGLLKEAGHSFVKEYQQAEVIILNTCGFITSARKEAKDYIRKIIKLKYTTKKEKPIFIVLGCLPQIEKENLIKQYPEIDAVVGVSEFPNISQIIQKITRLKKPILKITPPEFLYNKNYPRIISTPKSYAYLKIADGCDNRCSYCLIPTIRGNYRERPIEDIVEEAKKIVDSGVKELILISHDTTLYGTNIYGKKMLPELVRKLSKINNLKWLRILYTNPKDFDEKIINMFSETEKVCKYIDIPIQHTDDKILHAMNRLPSKIIFATIEKLRKKVKNITLRTTVMVGFPGETEQQFNKLLSDIKNLEFDWLGCFMYSRQKDTNAYDIPGQVIAKIKKERFDKVMSLQQQITMKKNKTRIGNCYDVLIDTPDTGHTEFQSPEVDGTVRFTTNTKDKNLSTGKIVKIKITQLNNIYDLEGKMF